MAETYCAAFMEDLPPEKQAEGLGVQAAADVAEVVRCKDCKHRTESGNCGHPRHHGILPSAYPYDFFSYVELKEGT